MGNVPGQSALGETVWVVYKRTPCEEGTFIGVFATKRLAQAAAHHPYDPASVIEVEVDELYDGWPGDIQ